MCLAAAALLAGCASFEFDVARTTSAAYVGSPSEAIAQLWSAPGAGDESLSGFLLLADGLDAFVARVELARRAQHTLDLQYYIIHSDETGKLLAREVVAAADRGVRVRILLDDIYAADADREILALASHPNIEVRLFNPWRRRASAVGRAIDFLSHVGRLNHRMHNKLLVADAAAVILGGRNLGDEYFGLHAGLDFRDLDVMALGPAAREAGQSFDEYWNSRFAVPAEGIQLRGPSLPFGQLRSALEEHAQAMGASPYVRALSDSPLARQFAANSLAAENARSRVLADHPEKISSRHAREHPDLVTQLRAQLGDPRQELLITSPYFVPGRDGVAVLSGLVGRGVRVAVLTNSLAATDVPLVHAGYARYRRALLRGGVSLYELKPVTAADRARVREQRFGSANASLHAKAICIDRRVLFVSTLNIDPRSIRYNTEIGIVIESERLAQQGAAMFGYITGPALSYEVRLGAAGGLEWHSTDEGRERIDRAEPRTSLWERFKNGLLRYVPFLEQQT